ncbi:GRIP domain-containing protein [Aphelenchoides avenae]|nr:GRIP domain-containing protein [Aphelenchus avenae]
MEAENERLMSDHGKVVAEMQQSYAKERVHVEQVERQLTELYKKVQEKDDLVKSYEGRLKQLAQLEEERDAWRRKADGTPTLTVLRQELANTKTSYEQELTTLRQRVAQSSAALAEKDERIADFEGRVRDVTAKGVRWEEDRVELQNTVADLQQQLKDADAQVAEWKQKARSAAATATSEDDEEDSERIRQRIRRDFDRLRQMGAAEDPYDLLGVERPAASLSESLHPAADLADVTSASASNENVTSSDFSERCDACHSAQKDLEYFKSLIGHLQKKIRGLEEKHDSTSTNYEKASHRRK